MLCATLPRAWGTSRGKGERAPFFLSVFLVWKDDRRKSLNVCVRVYAYVYVCTYV